MSVMQQSEPINSEDKYTSWTRWNQRNILTNLIQAEEHARYIDEDGFEPEHIACISKHLLSVRGELGELIGHTDKESERETAEEVILHVENKLEQLQKEGELITLDEIKRIRKEIEPEMEIFDTSNCESCGELAELINDPELLSDRGSKQMNMQGEAILTEDDDKEIEVQAVEDVDMHNQRRGGMSVSAALDPVVEFSQVPAVLGTDPQRVASFWGVPFVAGLADQSLELFTSELGQRVALGTGILGTSLAIATGRTSGQLTDDFLMMSGVWASGLADADTNEMQELGRNAALFQEGVQELNFVKVVESLVDTGGTEQLVNDVRGALDNGDSGAMSPDEFDQFGVQQSRQRRTTTTSSSRSSGAVRTSSSSDTSTTSESSSSQSNTIEFGDSSPSAGFDDDSSGFSADSDPF